MKSKWRHISFCFGLLIVAVALSSLAFANRNGASVSAVEKTTTTINVKGMTCQSCETGIEMTLRALNGVFEAHASYKTKKVIVTHDRNKITAEKLVDVIRELRYTAWL